MTQVMTEDHYKSIDDQFREFHASHPDVYEHFVLLARQLRMGGHKRYGAKGITEVIRFHRATSGKDAAGFKINNNYTSRLARMLIEDDPSFSGFFELRVLRSED